MHETAHLRDRTRSCRSTRALDDQFARSGAERAAGLAVGDGARDRGGVILGDAAIAHRLVVLAPLVDRSLRLRRRRAASPRVREKRFKVMVMGFPLSEVTDFRALPPRLGPNWDTSCALE